MEDCEESGSQKKEKDKGKNDKVKGTNNKGTDKEKGYEALIKPIQDVIAKDWKLKLCNYLDIYIEHIHEPGTVFINFTEAALLLQNTSTYYCKRVDLMYNWVRDFCFSLTEKYIEATTEEGESSQAGKSSDPKGTKKRSKKVKNPLHSDELELLPLAHTGSKTINFKLEKITGTEMKSILLNTNMKSQTKPATCIPVQQSASEEMGYKDEFRLHWKIVRSGLLLEDFQYASTSGDIEDDRLSDCSAMDDVAHEPDDLDDSGDTRRDADIDDRMDFEAVPPPSQDPDSLLPLPINDAEEHRGSVGSQLISEEPVEVAENAPDQAPKKNEDNFDVVIPFASLIIHRKFKRREIFKLPTEIIDEVKEMRSRKPKKSKKKAEEENANMKENDYNYHLNFSEILAGKSEDMIQHKLGKRKASYCSRRRRKNTKPSCPENNNLENACDLNNDTVEDDDRDIDDLMDDIDDLPMPEPEAAVGADGEENHNFDSNYEASAKAIGQMFKNKNDPLSITKRVTAWHEMIKPVLEKAEARSHFSVNEYGTRILDHFKEVGEVRRFADVVKGQPKEEICRYFLSTLMLANTYNLEIQRTSDDPLATDCLQMKLLSKVRHHEELDANVGATTANGPLL